MSESNPAEQEVATGPPVPFSSLPTPAESPTKPYNAWSVYGPNDELGFLNRQSAALVGAAARSEVQTGQRVSVNAPMDMQGSTPLFNRQGFEKKVWQKKPRIVHDDSWSFNTQCASQWDGLRHYGYQQAARFYNDTRVEDIAGTTDKDRNILGVQNFARQGICGRGVLVDVARWMDSDSGKAFLAQESGSSSHRHKPTPPFSSFTSWPITLPHLLATLAYQGTQVKYGDILLTRTGFHSALQSLSAAELTTLARPENQPPSVAGLAQSLPTLRWIWDHFSAVAGDQPSFEAWPPPADGPFTFHEVLLAGWGCPIGELLALDALGRVCEKLDRWSFFFVSEPVDVPGGVASPVNGLAIF